MVAQNKIMDLFIANHERISIPLREAFKRENKNLWNFPYFRGVGQTGRIVEKGSIAPLR